MPSASLPPQAEWPEHLFRVTSTITYQRTSSSTSFASPIQQRLRRQPRLEEAFLTEIHFRDQVARHLKSAHTHASGDVFNTPFISTTTSLRFALSVAELHGQRGGQDVTITLIDTTLIVQRPPIWDAEQVAKIIHLDRSKDDLKDEFLVFGSLEAPEQAFRAVKYLDLVRDLGTLIPAFLQKDDSKRERFSTFWKRIPKRDTPFKPAEVLLAFQIARAMATSRLTIPLMIMALFLEERVSYGPACIEEVVELVHRHQRQEDVESLFHFVLNASYGQATTNTPRTLMKVYDFLDEEYKPPPGSSSLEIKYVNWCLAALRQRLHDDQAAEIAEHFTLSPTALVVRQFTRGGADEVVKSSDRNKGVNGKLLKQYPLASDLAPAFFNLRRAVKKCSVRPLSRLNRLLWKVKLDIPREEGPSVIEFWTRQFEQITEKITTPVPEKRQNASVAGAKRSIDEVDAPVQAARKRVKVETTEVNMTMTVKRTVGYESDDQTVSVKEERVPW